ncbi:MAG: DUF1611 domain-containing protein [Chitinophagia bacterium]|nr:DUF1611 domain-containing protein [Chitinophagia bacterium]
MNGALILTNGLLVEADAKTAHGLIRGTERFTIKGVIDHAATAGKDAGALLDGRHRDIPIYASLDEACNAEPDVQYLVIGVATVGGRLPGDMLRVIEAAIEQGLSIVNGLHEFLTEKPAIVAKAAEKGVTLTDVRKPKSRDQLHFFTGEIFQVPVPIVAVIGMDCAMGKRTTARMLTQAVNKTGKKAQMIYTGQTGWLQGGKYGFIFDSTINDFVSGELEHAIVSCWKETQPDIIFLEGQSALRNPSGPCGSELLLSGNAKKVVLLYSPRRKYFDNEAHWGNIPSVESEIALIQLYGAEVIALALHTEGCTQEEALEYQKTYEQLLSIPVLLPIEQGVDAIVAKLLSST